MKKLFCLALLSVGFVGCSAGTTGTPEERAKTMSTPPAGAPAEGTTPPAADAGKEAAEAPKEPAPAATEAAEAK